MSLDPKSTLIAFYFARLCHLWYTRVHSHNSSQEALGRRRCAEDYFCLKHCITFWPHPAGRRGRRPLRICGNTNKKPTPGNWRVDAGIDPYSVPGVGSSFILRQGLRHQFPDGGGQLFVLAGGEEILGEMLAGESALDQVAVQILQDVGQVAKGNSAHAVQNLLVALLGHNALLGVALAVAEAEQLLEDVLEVQLTASALAHSSFVSNVSYIFSP